MKNKFTIYNLQFTINKFLKKHCQLSIIHSPFHSGFTLVELLIVVAILAFVGSIATIILVTSFRTSTKTDIINSVKENGNFAITQMANTIRYAKNVQCPPSPTPPASVIVTANDNSQISFDCNNNAINMNGSALIDTTSVTVVPNTCVFTCVQSDPTVNPIMQITFSLQKISTSQLVEQNAPPIQFSTSVTLRNSIR